MSIETGLSDVRERITRAANAAGRAPSSVRLVAVSKRKPAAAIREAYAAGQRDFGENYAQELSEKADELRDLKDLRWHFIGHLQSNKARWVAQCASFVHTVDSASLARELAKRYTPRFGETGAPLPVLVEINTGAEAHKEGTSSDQLGAVLEAIDNEPALKLHGLMTMPPHDLAAARVAFESLAFLRDAHGVTARMPELSMGMSDDLEIAVACGSTLVRVGTAIFGSR